MRSRSLLTVATFLAPAAAVAQEAIASGSTVSGIVTEVETREPITDVFVEIEGTTRSVRTDSAGRYRLLDVPTGPQTLRARRLGYAPARVTVTFPPSGSVVRHIELARSGLRLSDVIVTADPTGRARGELGTANVIDREAIAHQSSASLAGVLELTPGVPLAPPGLDGVQQIPLRSVPASPGNADAGAPSAGDLASFGTLIVQDGVPLSNNTNLQSTGARGELSVPSSAGGGIDLRRIPASTIDRVEVIRGIPSARYGDLTQGAIIVETRAGEIRPEALGRYDAHTLAISAVGGRALGSQQVAAATLDLTHTNTSPGLRDDDALRFSSQLSHRLSVVGIERDRPRAVLDSRIDAWQLYANNPEHADLLPGYSNWSRDFGLRFAERVRVGQRDGRRFELLLSADYTSQRSESRRNLIRGAQPFTDRLTEGRSIGRFVGGSYPARVWIEGSPWLLFGRVEGMLPAKRFGFEHRLLAGVELRREWNSGPGYQFDIEFPPQATFNGVQGFSRPRRYDDIPPIAASGWYLDDRLTHALPNDITLDVQGGLRVDVLHQGTQWLSGARDISVQPRLNAQLAPRPWLRLRAGAGRSAKLPTLGDLYPAREFYDVVNVNWFVPEPEERLAVLTTFIRDGTNPDLGFSTGKKAEVGIEVDLGRSGASISFVAFADGIDGAVGPHYLIDFITREFYALDDSAGVTDRPPNIVEPPEAVDTVPIATRQPGNNLTMRNRGIELTALFPRIPGLRTRAQILGSWVESRVISDEIDFGQGDRFGSFQLDSAQERLPYFRGVDRTGTRGLVTYRLIHQQPEMGLVVTATVQQFVYEKTRDVAATDTLAFAGYVTRDGTLVPVPPQSRGADEFADLRVTRSGLFTLPAGAPSDWLASIQVSKTLPLDGRLSFYAFNAFDRIGVYDRLGIRGRQHSPLRFGLEITMPLMPERASSR